MQFSNKINEHEWEELNMFAKSGRNGKFLSEKSCLAFLFWIFQCRKVYNYNRYIEIFQSLTANIIVWHNQIDLIKKYILKFDWNVCEKVKQWRWNIEIIWHKNVFCHKNCNCQFETKEILCVNTICTGLRTGRHVFCIKFLC